MDRRAAPLISLWLIIGTIKDWGTRPDWPVGLNLLGIALTIAWMGVAWVIFSAVRGRSPRIRPSTFDLFDIALIAFLPAIPAAVIDGDSGEGIRAFLGALSGVGLIYVITGFGLIEIGGGRSHVCGSSSRTSSSCSPERPRVADPRGLPALRDGDVGGSPRDDLGGAWARPPATADRRRVARREHLPWRATARSANRCRRRAGGCRSHAGRAACRARRRRRAPLPSPQLAATQQRHAARRYPAAAAGDRRRARRDGVPRRVRLDRHPGIGAAGLGGRSDAGHRRLRDARRGSHPLGGARRRERCAGRDRGVVLQWARHHGSRVPVGWIRSRDRRRTPDPRGLGALPWGASRRPRRQRRSRLPP